MKNNTKITCLVVDDEPLAVDLLENHIGQIPFLELIGKCYNALEAVAFLDKNKVDVIFLDINMPQLSGMQLKSFLPANQQVIFTTAYSEFAVESYEKNAFDYLLKPITFERFLKSAMRLRELANEPLKEDPKNSDFFIKSGKELIRLSYDQIKYIEGLGDYVTIVCQDKNIVTYRRMKDLEETLPDNFQRVHLSYIVNTDKITKIVDNQILIGEQRVPLSDKYRETFTNKIDAKIL